LPVSFVVTASNPVLSEATMKPRNVLVTSAAEAGPAPTMKAAAERYPFHHGIAFS
jgi:hypothetical protein